MGTASKIGVLGGGEFDRGNGAWRAMFDGWAEAAVSVEIAFRWNP